MNPRDDCHLALGFDLEGLRGPTFRGSNSKATLVVPELAPNCVWRGELGVRKLCRRQYLPSLSGPWWSHSGTSGPNTLLLHRERTALLSFILYDRLERPAQGRKWHRPKYAIILRDQIAASTRFSLAVTSPAIAVSAGLPIRSIPESGSTAETSTPSDFSWTITLQGSMAPILSSTCSA